MKRLISVMAALLMWLSVSVYASAEEETWYLQRAEALKDDLYALVAYDGFAEAYASGEEVIELIDAWKLAMESEPERVSGYGLPDVSLLLADAADGQALPDAMVRRLERSMASVLISQINGMQGVYFLAASSVPVMTEGYVMPEQFAPCMIVYEYEGVCVCVSFVRLGEEVVSATAQFCAPEITELLAGQ